MNEYQGMVVLNPLTGEGFVEHYGVKGMKWYQHKFGREQNQAQYAKDGASDKAAKVGKGGSGSGGSGKSGKASIGKKLKGKANEVLEKHAADKRQKILNDPKKLYKHRKEFSKTEIDDAMKTFKWENDLQRISADRISNGKRMVDDLVGTFSKGIDGYNAFARVYNTVAGSKGYKKIPYVENANSGGKDKKKDDD